MTYRLGTMGTASLQWLAEHSLSGNPNIGGPIMLMYLLAYIPISNWQRSRFDAPLAQPNTLTTQLSTSLEETLTEGVKDVQTKKATCWPLMPVQISK